MDRLKELRVSAGMTQTQLADAVGIVQNTVAQYESGRRTMTLETACKFADLFGCSLDYLLGRSDEPLYKKEAPGAVVLATEPEAAEIPMQLVQGAPGMGKSSTIEALLRQLIREEMAKQQ